MKNQKAAGSENAYTGIVIQRLKGKESIHMALDMLIPRNIQNDDVIYLCIGTDRSTGDSLAPLVGTYLKGLGYTNVYGSLDEPVHAQNLQETINSLPQNKSIIAIDAGLGSISSVGTTQVIKGSIKPGAGVNKIFPSYGDYSIMGIVNVGGFMEYFVLQSTRLSLVMKMAKDITSAIVERFPLEYKKDKRSVRNYRDEVLVKRIKKKGLEAKLVKNK